MKTLEWEDNKLKLIDQTKLMFIVMIIRKLL